MKVCLGFSHGWLALEYDNKAIKLVNPFKYSVAPISLPPLEYPNKVTLSADPITSPSDYVVAAIYHWGRLAFKRASQSFWIRVDKNELWCTNVVFIKVWYLLTTLHIPLYPSSSIILLVMVKVFIL